MKKARKVFLENLPKKKGVGCNKNNLVIDWENSIGYKVHFGAGSLTSNVKSDESNVTLTINSEKFKTSQTRCEFYLMPDLRKDTN